MDTKVEIKPNALKSHDLEQLTADLDVPKIYANGFQSQLTLNDGNIVLIQNNVPVGVLITTLSGIKSLRDQLNLLMNKYTENTGEIIDSYEELLMKIQKKVKDRAKDGKL